MKKIQKLIIDVINLSKILQLKDYLFFIFLLIRNSFKILQDGTLVSIDEMYGNEVKVKNGSKVITINSNRILGQIREIWARKVYSKGNFFDNIENDATVLDLGANVGTFTLYALSRLKVEKMISIEPNSDCNETFKKNIAINFPNANVILLSAFIGDFSEKQNRLLLESGYEKAKIISMEQLIFENNIKKIDFLKCDIEGGEYSILTKDSNLLKITKKLAVEIHDFAGKRNELIEQIKSSGFKVRHYIDNPNDCIILAEKA